MIRPLLVVVDDEQTSLELVEDSASNTGFEVQSFTRAFELQSFLNKNKPAVLILDIVMPDIDGLELIQWLADNNCKTPIIMTSGYDGKYLNDATKLAARSGLNVKATFNKPVALHDLEESLGNLYHRLVSN